VPRTSPGPGAEALVPVSLDDNDPDLERVIGDLDLAVEHNWGVEPPTHEDQGDGWWPWTPPRPAQPTGSRRPGECGWLCQRVGLGAEDYHGL
jgi:hypothetical protein